MNTEKKVRGMSPKGFLFKSTTKAAASADAFLKAHKEWLLTGNLAEVTSPILKALDSKEIMPTPALDAIKLAVTNHMIMVEINKGEAAMAAREEVAEPKNWIATIYTAKGEIATKKDIHGKVVDLQEQFDIPQDADRWTDRRLFDGECTWYGIVSHTKIVNKDGDPLSTIVMRTDAIGRILAKKKGPVVKGESKGNGKLGFGVSCKQSVAKFSHG